METIKQFVFPLFRLKREHLAILISLLTFLNFPWLSRHWDITSAAIDAGALSAVAMAIFALLLFKAITWWLVKTLWPALASYSNYHFANNFQPLSACHKVLIYLGFYLLLLYSFVLTLAALV
jgi:hypothetical protein